VPLVAKLELITKRVERALRLHSSRWRFELEPEIQDTCAPSGSGPSSAKANLRSRVPGSYLA
jgi:hypothetical protein